MIVRQDFANELPPKMFLMQILDNLAKVYVFLWEKKDNFNRFRMTWKELSKYYNKNVFRSSLRKLCNEGLISYSENKNGCTVEMVGWEEFNGD